jgi:hypothetical protein
LNDPSGIDLRIESITFSGSPEPVSTIDSEVIVIVGPNNSGKSRALREIQQRTAASDAATVVISALKARRQGTVTDLKAWLQANAPEVRTTNPGSARIFAGRRRREVVHMALEAAALHWAQNDSLQETAYFLMLLADAETRLELAASVDSIDALVGDAIEPLQRLLVDHAAERRLADSVKRAFDEPVSVNRAGGSRLHLHLGRAIAEPRLDSEEYLEELRGLPLVAEQGDGMRSFIGLMLTVLATPYPVILVDEPEAFLHPPQAREIGRQLGKPTGRQRFVATHSSDVLLGLLDQASPTTIIRLRRLGQDQNVPAVLSQQDIRELLDDPTLRYSNLLDGLFHRGVVMCEADGDARLYGAALDVELDTRQQPSPDLLFTHCGGKQKLPDALRAMRALDVPVAAIADFDVLRNESPLKEIIEVLGGVWESLRPDWQAVASAIATQPPVAPLVGDLRAELDEQFGSDNAARLSEEQSRTIRELTKSTDGWRALKTSGLAGVPRGAAATAARRLLPRLRDLGLFIVEIGELESWAPEIGRHGASFVTAALEAKVHETAAPLRKFVFEVAEGVTRVERADAPA